MYNYDLWLLYTPVTVHHTCVCDINVFSMGFWDTEYNLIFKHGREIITNALLACTGLPQK